MNVLVTGGASGLGEAITKRLAANPDSKIYFTYSKSDLKARRIESEFSNTNPIKCDFSNESEIVSLVDSINGMDLDVLINNAYNGDFLKKHFHKILLSDFETDFKLNILPTIAITQSAIKNFRKKKSGKIITILTAALLNIPPIGSSVYVANKAYLEKLTKIWAIENSNFNITSNAVSPSFMQTNLTASMDERIVEQIRESHPLKKLLTVEEVADAILFLINSSSHINGIDLVINAASDIK